MSGRRTNSWGDPIPFSQTLAVEQKRPGPSSHAEMSWTVCYDDDCEIHLREKHGSGWFPKRRGRKGPRNWKWKGKGARRDLDEDDPENRPWGDSGDGGGCPIPTEDEVKVILARKAAREAAEARAKAASGVNKGVQIGREEEEAKPKTKITGEAKLKAAPEAKSDWAERIRELLAGGVKADGGARLNTPEYANNVSGGLPAGAVAKPMSSAGNPTLAVAKQGSHNGKGQFVPPSRTVASADSNSGCGRKQFTPPVTTAPVPAKPNPTFDGKLSVSPPFPTPKTAQKTHFNYPHTTATPAVHNPIIDKKRFSSPLAATTHAPVISDPHTEKKQFAPSLTPNHHQKQPLQSRKDQGKTNRCLKPSKMLHQNSPVTTILPTAVIAARVAAKAKLAAEREDEPPQMAKYKRVISAKAGIV